MTVRMPCDNCGTLCNCADALCTRCAKFQEKLTDAMHDGYIPEKQSEDYD